MAHAAAPGLATPLEAIDKALVGAETPPLDEAEPEALVEAVGARVARQRIDEHRRHLRVGDGPQPGRRIAPVAALFARRVDDLHEAHRPAVHLGDELLAPVGRARELRFPAPVVVRVGGDDMRLLVPAAQQLEVGGGGRAQDYRRPTPLKNV
jgi:hypothetical protein